MQRRNSLRPSLGDAKLIAQADRQSAGRAAGRSAVRGRGRLGPLPILCFRAFWTASRKSVVADHGIRGDLLRSADDGADLQEGTFTDRATTPDAGANTDVCKRPDLHIVVAWRRTRLSPIAAIAACACARVAWAARASRAHLGGQSTGQPPRQRKARQSKGDEHQLRIPKSIPSLKQRHQPPHGVINDLLRRSLDLLRLARIQIHHSNLVHECNALRLAACA